MPSTEKQPINPLFVSRVVHNTLALPCLAESAWLLEEESCLSRLPLGAKDQPQPKVVGGGSNLILPPRLRGPTILVALKGITVVQESLHSVTVTVAAGEPWHEWVQTALNSGWFGLENLALIPGTVGASPVQNIGAYGVEVSQFVTSVRVWDFSLGATRDLSASDCQFAYRDSLFKKPQGQSLLILSVTFHLPKQPAWSPMLNYPDVKPLEQAAREEGLALTPQRVFDHVVAVRSRKLPDPSERPNAGSFFKNPVVSSRDYQQLLARFPALVAYPQSDGRFKLAAGWMIDQCGWRGRRVGPVGVHERQALVLVNFGQASAAQLLALAQDIRCDVAATFGVELEIEPICWA